MERPLEETTNILVGATGSVATIKVPQLVGELTKGKGKVEVRVVMTESASKFVSDEDILAAGATHIYRDQDEWDTWKEAKSVLHIALRRWAHVFVIAPLDANSLAKLAGGLCDNLLTCVARAWDMQRPLLFCPAMNTHMWTHPFTARHVKVLEDELHYVHVPPIAKKLACGDVGVGAMASVESIALCVVKALSRTARDSPAASC